MKPNNLHQFISLTKNSIVKVFVIATLAMMPLQIFAMDYPQPGIYGGGGPNDPPPPPGPDGPPCKGCACGSGNGDGDDGTNKDPGSACADNPPPECPDLVGDPVSPYNGALLFTVTDMEVKGVFPIRLDRRYDSRSDYLSALGYGWAFNFDRALYEYADNSIIIRSQCGARNKFNFTGGAYQREVGSSNSTLVRNGDGSYTVTFANGYKDHYDLQGKLTAVEDAIGNKLEVIYDARGKLPITGISPYAVNKVQPLAIAHAFRIERVQERLVDGTLTGNTINFSYNDTTGLLSTVTSNDGRVITYGHDEWLGATKGNLVTVNGLDGYSASYDYNDSTGTVNDHHNISQIIDSGTQTILRYDLQDRVVQQLRTLPFDTSDLQSYGSDQITFDYEIPLTRTVVNYSTQAMGPAQTVSFIRPYKNTYEFDTVGYKSKIIDAYGNETRYFRNGQGVLEREELYENTGTLAAPVLQLVKTIAYSINADGNQFSNTVTLDSGEVITQSFTYDGLKLASEQTVSSLQPAKIFRTEWEYNHNTSGAPTTLREERKRKDDGSYQVTGYTYNNYGGVLTATLPDGHVIVNEYGPAYGGKYITKNSQRVSGVAVPDLAETYLYDNKGNVSQVTDAKGHVTTLQYDGHNRVTRVTNHLGHVVTNVYDARGNLTNIIRDKTISNDQLDNTHHIYDAYNRLHKIERSNDAGDVVTQITLIRDTRDNLVQIARTNPPGALVQYAYDSKNRLTTITEGDNTINYTLDVQGNVTLEEWKNAQGVTVFTRSADFDDLHRSTQIRGAQDQAENITYDALGNIRTYTDQLSRPSTDFTFNSLSQLANVKDAANNNTAFYYHVRGWLERITDPRSLTTQYNYNDLGLLESLVSPDTGTTGYTYDLAGNLQTKTDARGITATYGYDALDRLQTITYPTTAKNVTLTYDQGINGLGKLTGMLDETGTTTVEYNAFGNIAKEIKLISGHTYTTEYGYDYLQRLTSITYPGGRVVTYVRDTYGKITSVTSNDQSTNQTLASSISYVPFGGIDQLTFGNSLLLDNTYDLDYRLTNQVVGSIYNRTIAHNDVNNIASITDNLDATRNQSMAYDNLNRLQDASGIYGALHYDYDADGNRIGETLNVSQSSTYNYPVTSNRLTDIIGAKASSFAYDNVGNTTQQGAITLVYDDTNRLSQATNGATVAQYFYNAKGQRVIKQIGTTITVFHYDLAGKLIAETNTSGTLIREYVYLQDQPLAMIKYGTNAGTYYYHVNHLNTPKVMTNQSQAVVWRADSEPFGKVNITTSTIENPLRFPGQYFDAETGNHYNYFRDYSPELGRYISSDPIGLEGGVNTYSYVYNNPVNYIDPDGRLSLIEVVVVVVVVAAVVIPVDKYISDWIDSNNAGNDAFKDLEYEIDHTPDPESPSACERVENERSKLPENMSNTSRSLFNMYKFQKPYKYIKIIP